MGLTTDKIETTSGANSFYTDEEGNLVVGSVAQTFLSDTAEDFETPEQNVSWSTNKWANAFVYDADYTDGKTATAQTETGGYEAAQAIDNSEAGNGWIAANDLNKTQWLKVDLGQSRTVIRLRMRAYIAYANAKLTKVEVSDDDTSWTTTWTGSAAYSNTGMTTIDITASTGRYVRVTVNDTVGRPSITEIEMLGGVSASTSNKFIEEDLVAGGPALSFDPSESLFKTLSSGGTDVTTDLAIEYSRDNRNTWNGPYTVAEFKALSADLFAACEYLHRRFKLTGSQTLGYVRMSSVASTIKMGTDATFEIKLAGGVTFSVSALGAVLASGELSADAFKGGQVTVDHADSPYDLDTNYTTVLIDATDTVTINIPTAVGKKGRRYTFKEIAGSATITIDAAGDETIEGQATLTVTDYRTIESDGANWWIVG